MRAPGAALKPTAVSTAPEPARKRDALLAACPLAPARAPGRCGWCAAELPERRRSWCSDRCGELFWTNHWWSLARGAAKRRDKYRCTRCGVAAPKRPAQRQHRSHAAYLAAMRAWRSEKRTRRLEVNHMSPCAGKHGELSCAHHLLNLETLCLDCHRTHTAALRAAAEPRAPRARRASPAAPVPRRGTMTA